MADRKVTQLTALTSPANTDLLLIIDDPSGSPVSKKVTVEDLLGNSNQLVVTTMNVRATSDATYAANNITLDANTTITLTRGTVINEDGADSDTRIESDNDANMVFIDASTDRLGIKTNAPQETFDINSDSMRVRTAKTPANSDNSTVGWPVGRIAWDSNYIYVAISSTVIKRASLLTF